MLVCRFIGLTGKAGSGKDTAADFLSTLVGVNRIALAYPLKEGLNTMFDFCKDDWRNREWKEADNPILGTSPRRLAQTLGTEWGRNTIHPDIWLRVAEIRLLDMPPENHVIVTDVRFPNEAAWIRKRHGVVVEIVRPEAYRVEEHKSEDGVGAEADIVIVNDGDIPTLHARLQEELYIVA